MNKLVFILLITFSISSIASTYSCTGNVKGVAIGPTNGEVKPEKVAGLDWPVLCSVESEMAGITVESCKSILSILLAAQMSNKTVTLWFNNEGGSCNGHTAWHRPEGYYFGPRINN